MELTKRKYKKSEVEEIVNNSKVESLQLIKEKEEQIAILNQENKNLLAQLENYKNQDALIGNAIKSAESKAQDIVKKAEINYSVEMENLRIFTQRFSGYFSYIIEKYPHYPAVKETNDIYEKLKEIVANNNGKGAFDKAEKIVNKLKIEGKKVAFDPKSKIEDYIATTSDNGFNLNDVLNPGELHLEDLCKELGLIEEEK